MISAAGIKITTASGLTLYLKRGNGSDHPNEWCFPGGQQEEGETLEECARRETVEEAGSCPEGTLLYLTRCIAPAEAVAAVAPVAEGGEVPASPPAPSEAVDFTTFLVKVPEPFPVILSSEHTGYAWAASPPEPVHPGCAIALERGGMDEQQVAQAIATERLTSPQRIENSCLFAMRVTGTGVAYRLALDEFAWRDPSVYLNEHFLSRCNGLPVIWEHPKTASLNSKEFSDRVIGTLIFAWIKGYEVWGIARVFDAEAISLMLANKLSTSPAVVFTDPSENTKMLLEDGSTILFEGNPRLLDHLAVCGQGVWDKGEAPSGIAVTDSAEAKPQETLSTNALRAFADSIALMDFSLGVASAMRKLDLMEK